MLAINPKIIKAYYEQEAMRYKKERPFLESYVLSRQIRIINSILSRKHDCILILNIGCGNTHLENQIAGADPILVVLDIARKMVQITKAAAPFADGVVADGNHPPFREGSFDIIICSRAIKFLDLRTFGHNINYLLRSKGICLITLDSGGDVRWTKILKKLNKLRTRLTGFVEHEMYTSTQIEEVLMHGGLNIIGVFALTSLPLKFFKYIPKVLWKSAQIFDRPKKGRLTLIIGAKDLRMTLKFDIFSKEYSLLGILCLPVTLILLFLLCLGYCYALWFSS
jgi:hypothetical protein